ncbi:MAG: hypothetical protein HYU41_05785 [Candidatus Rokubacteria bacterium]|nr:hypothetical protein [Candidatus Rokubacteria bacterium]
MRRRTLLASLLAVAATVALSGAAAWAEPVTVRFAEGITRAFPVLKSVDGLTLAHGEIVQIARGDQVDSRLMFRYTDGSHYEERVVFSQRGVFTLVTYRLRQHGPSFPESIDAFVDRDSGLYTVRYKADLDSAEEILNGRIELPPDTYNGLLTTVLKNLPAGTSATVHIMAFTPRPRPIQMLLAPSGEETLLMGGFPMPVTKFTLRPQLGMFASLLVTDLPDVKCWILGGDAPAFVKFEGPLYFMGPVWRIEPH